MILELYLMTFHYCFQKNHWNQLLNRLGSIGFLTSMLYFNSFKFQFQEQWECCHKTVFNTIFYKTVFIYPLWQHLLDILLAFTVYNNNNSPSWWIGLAFLWYDWQPLSNHYPTVSRLFFQYCLLFRKAVETVFFWWESVTWFFSGDNGMFKVEDLKIDIPMGGEALSLHLVLARPCLDMIAAMLKSVAHGLIVQLSSISSPISPQFMTHIVLSPHPESKIPEIPANSSGYPAQRNQTRHTLITEAAVLTEGIFQRHRSSRPPFQSSAAPTSSKRRAPKHVLVIDSLFKSFVFGVAVASPRLTGTGRLRRRRRRGRRPRVVKSHFFFDRCRCWQHVRLWFFPLSQSTWAGELLRAFEQWSDISYTSTNQFHFKNIS